MVTGTRVDRAALVRRALVELVAERGFRGATMASVADRAGVATGTAYVHYASKDDLIIAAYCDVKRALGAAAVRDIDPAAPPGRRFRALWHAIYAHLAADPVRARFLAQIEASPHADAAHAAAADDPGDELMAAAAAPDMHALLAELPPDVLYDLGLGPAVRLAASRAGLDGAGLDRVAEGCWRAVTRAGT